MQMVLPGLEQATAPLAQVPEEVPAVLPVEVLPAPAPAAGGADGAAAPVLPAGALDWPTAPVLTLLEATVVGAEVSPPLREPVTVIIVVRVTGALVFDVATEDAGPVAVPEGTSVFAEGAAPPLWVDMPLFPDEGAPPLYDDGA